MRRRAAAMRTARPGMPEVRADPCPTVPVRRAPDGADRAVPGARCPSSGRRHQHHRAVGAVQQDVLDRTDRWTGPARTAVGEPSPSGDDMTVGHCPVPLLFRARGVHPREERRRQWRTRVGRPSLDAAAGPRRVLAVRGRRGQVPVKPVGPPSGSSHRGERSRADPAQPDERDPLGRGEGAMRRSSGEVHPVQGASADELTSGDQFRLDADEDLLLVPRSVGHPGRAGRPMSRAGRPTRRLRTVTPCRVRPRPGRRSGAGPCGRPGPDGVRTVRNGVGRRPAGPPRARR